MADVHRFYRLKQVLFKIVDSTVGYEMMALLDCFSRYHQIWLRKEDKEKTSFITPLTLFAILECPKVCAMSGQHSAE
jgi:hypothetical protein